MNHVVHVVVPAYRDGDFTLTRRNFRDVRILIASVVSRGRIRFSQLGEARRIDVQVDAECSSPIENRGFAQGE